jgi:serine/threonine protein kinase
METIHTDCRKFYLLFSFADGNLRQFWRVQNPHSDNGQYGIFSRWVAQQCQGLANALRILHDLREVEGERPPAAEDQDDPYYGIHGDIKPANLLWYKRWDGYTDTPHELGVIQLADFGISTVHHTESRSDVKLGAHTKTYRPPEVELGETVGRSFDIWGLGCVFLEFLLWLVKDNTEKTANEFISARKRKNKNEDGLKQDTFYLIKNGVATVHPAVRSV